MQVNNTRYHTKKQDQRISPIPTDALYNVVFIVIMYEVWIYFERFLFVFSLLFWENKLLSCYLVILILSISPKVRDYTYANFLRGYAISKDYILCIKTLKNHNYINEISIL